MSVAGQGTPLPRRRLFPSLDTHMTFSHPGDSVTPLGRVSMRNGCEPVVPRTGEKCPFNLQMQTWFVQEHLSNFIYIFFSFYLFLFQIYQLSLYWAHLHI